MTSSEEAQEACNDAAADSCAAAESCADDTAGARVPLPRLLAEAEAAFAAEFDKRMRRGEFATLSLAHSRNVLRHLGDGPLRARDIVGDCGVSKQALSQQIAHLEQGGYVAIEPDPADARARLVTLTEKGARAQQIIRRLFIDIENDWAAEFGADDLATVRRVLVALLTRGRTRAGSPGSHSEILAPTHLSPRDTPAC
ncbi:MAG: winged helix-turn-helix transcriptional regulator [Micropruina sp.]|nr:winged helix-turn-helix transcriptional regulator [Micropruina sp.]